MDLKTQKMSGDDDLAKALVGGLQFEETPLTTPTTSDNANATTQTAEPKLPSLSNDDNPTMEDIKAPALPTPTVTATPDPELPSVQHITAQPTPAVAAKTPAVEPTTTTPPTVTTPTEHKPLGDGELDKLKSEALEDLRPLVGKLNLPADELFDTILLVIRSTDDKSLLDPLHQAAKAITDETRRAQALVDVIKEIDFFEAK